MADGIDGTDVDFVRFDDDVEGLEIEKAPHPHSREPLEVDAGVEAALYVGGDVLDVLLRRRLLVPDHLTCCADEGG